LNESEITSSKNDFLFTDLFVVWQKNFPICGWYNKIQWRYGWKCPHFMYIVALVSPSCHTHVTIMSHSCHTRVTLMLPQQLNGLLMFTFFKYPFSHGSYKMASRLWRKIPCLRGSSCKVCNWNIDCDNYY